MKKSMYIAITLVLVLTLAGCGNKEKDGEINKVESINQGNASGEVKNAYNKKHVNAYVNKINELEKENDESEFKEELKYDLIYIDSDNTPELVVGYQGYWVSVYSFDGENVKTVMDHWGYGAMGNAGYDYIPRENKVMNTDADYAGGVLYNSTFAMAEDYELKLVSCHVTYNNFIDKNGNGVFDDDEADTFGEGDYSYEADENVEVPNNLLPISDFGGEKSFMDVDKTKAEILELLNNM